VGRGEQRRKKMDESLAPLSSMGTKSDPKTTIRWKNQEKLGREKSSNPLYYLLLLPPSSLITAAPPPSFLDLLQIPRW
jgi:hypothetical protein